MQHSGRERNQVAPEQGAFLGWLVQALGARRAIELGTFTGYSSLCLALVRSGPQLSASAPGCLHRSMHLAALLH